LCKTGFSETSRLSRLCLLIKEKWQTDKKAAEGIYLEETNRTKAAEPVPCANGSATLQAEGGWWGRKGWRAGEGRRDRLRSSNALLDCKTKTAREPVQRKGGIEKAVFQSAVEASRGGGNLEPYRFLLLDGERTRTGLSEIPCAFRRRKELLAPGGHSIRPYTGLWRRSAQQE